MPTDHYNDMEELDGASISKQVLHGEGSPSLQARDNVMLSAPGRQNESVDQDLKASIQEFTPG